MKKAFLWILLMFIISKLFSQNEARQVRADNIAFRKQQHAEFADSMHSPLTTEDLKFFRKLDFFGIKKHYCVKAVLTLNTRPEVFEMPRSKGNTGTYRKYGEAVFYLRKKQFRLSLYQSMKLLADNSDSDYLFLPFSDLSNGKQTYVSGRYLDLKIPQGDTIIIDFNKAYNPYCCYNSKYSCPIPPPENQVNMVVRAGEKVYRRK